MLVAHPCDLQGDLILECPVRTTTTARVAVRNPLSTEVTLKGSTTSKLVTVAPSTVLPPYSVTPITVSYRPLLVGEAEAALKLECPELGAYEWGLKLRGASTPPEKAITFNAPLGVRETHVFRFMHYLEEKADYKVGGSGSDADLHMEWQEANSSCIAVLNQVRIVL
jgi:hydrocephalus-inducing protein